MGDSEKPPRELIKVKPASEQTEFTKTNPYFVFCLLKIFKITSLYLNPLFYVSFSAFYFLNYSF